MANFLLTDAIHAERRAEEAAMSAEALEEIGIEPIMTRSTVKRLQWVADLGMKDHFGGVVPKHYSEAIDAIEAARPSTPSRRSSPRPPARGRYQLNRTSFCGQRW